MPNKRLLILGILMIICKICSKEFETTKELTKHLIVEHDYTIAQVYEYFNYSFESGGATCPVCGKEFIMTKRQIEGFKKNSNKSIGCCVACSKSIIILTHGSPLANPEIYKKTKESLKEHYNVEHPAQAKEVRDKIKATTLKHLGVENSMQSEKVQRKRKSTNLERYGSEEYLATEKAKETRRNRMLEKYGVENAFQSVEVKEGIKKVHLKKRGVEHPMQSKESQENMKATNLKKYGVEFPLQSQEIQDKTKRTNINKYGVESPFQLTDLLDQIKEKKKETMLKKYGVEYFCQHPDCYNASHKRISKINRKCHEFLKKNGVESELEYILENSGYDLKVGNNLVEINPYFTHNSTIGPTFGNYKEEPKPFDYHLSKTTEAKKHGFSCIHIFDWDDWNKVAHLLQDREKIAARKCEVREIKSKEANDFLSMYHLQGSTRQVKYACGLFYNNELVQVMTFGKPRYNKNYEYELLRLCTIPKVSVIGGASKLLKYFEEQVKPKSLLSYCDLSKFNGEVYEKLGFTLVSQTAPAKHWYNPKTKVHITDNFLRQRGFDQLHNANFGKGTSNEQLMLEHGYVEIYDCGQLVFAKNFSK